MKYWYGPWIWGVSPLSGWYPPPGCRPTLDLRSDVMSSALLRSSQAGSAGEGFGLFCAPDEVEPGQGYDFMGDHARYILTPTMRQRLAGTLGVPFIVGDNSLAAFMWEATIASGDPQGFDNCRPMTIASNRQYILKLEDELVWDRFYPVSREGTSTVTLLQNEYRRIRDDALAGILPADQHLIMLSVWEWKYRIPYQAFIPDDLPDEGTALPSTTISDNFDGPDSPILGKQLVWTEAGGTDQWDNWSNQARKLTTDGSASDRLARADSVLSSDDHYSQIEVTSLPQPSSMETQFGVTCRVEPGASPDTYYFLYGNKISTGVGPDMRDLWKVVNGAFTQLTTEPEEAMTLPDTMRIQADGSTIRGYLNDVQKRSVTDTGITSNLYCGMYGLAYTNAYPCGDDFEAADLISGVPIPVFEKHYRTMRR